MQTDQQEVVREAKHDRGVDRDEGLDERSSGAAPSTPGTDRSSYGRL